jgi:hypothetical protein
VGRENTNEAIGANLDREQIIKGWSDTKGKTHEKVCDVAWSSVREPVADGRLPSVGDTVDIEAANWLKGAQTTGQERTYTSLIWYSP